MKKAYFQALGLEIPLGKFQKFTDHGFVEDPRKYTKSSGVPAFGLAWATEGRFKARPIDHLFSQDRSFDRRFVHAHICYEQSLKDELNGGIKIRAHEETHALQALGKLDHLEKALQEEQGVKINLHSIRDIEVCAEVGAVYAWRKKCKENIESLRHSVYKERDQYLAALRLYIWGGGTMGWPGFERVTNLSRPSEISAEEYINQMVFS